MGRSKVLPTVSRYLSHQPFVTATQRNTSTKAVLTPMTAISLAFMYKTLGSLMGRRISTLAPIFLLAAIFPRNVLQINSALPQDFTYHSSASEVRLVFFATDERNHHVATLQRDDFAVVDNGWVIRDFRSFNPSHLGKLDVTVLIDLSESVLPRFRREITNALTRLVQWPWEPKDRISILSFSGTEVSSVCDGDCRGVFAESRLASLPSGGATPLFDAVMAATDSLKQRRQPDVWPVLIVFSDGNDTISKASFTDILAEIMASGEQVYTVDLGEPGEASRGNAVLRRIADESGGRCFPLNNGLVAILNDVIEDLHAGQLVTYSPPESRSEFHSIRILPTRNLDLHFRSRQGYYQHHSGGAYQENVP